MAERPRRPRGHRASGGDESSGAEAKGLTGLVRWLVEHRRRGDGAVVPSDADDAVVPSDADDAVPTAPEPRPAGPEPQVAAPEAGSRAPTVAVSSSVDPSTPAPVSEPGSPAAGGPDDARRGPESVPTPADRGPSVDPPPAPLGGSESDSAAPSSGPVPERAAPPLEHPDPLAALLGTSPSLAFDLVDGRGEARFDVCAGVQPLRVVLSNVSAGTALRFDPLQGIEDHHVAIGFHAGLLDESLLGSITVGAADAGRGWVASAVAGTGSEGPTVLLRAPDALRLEPGETVSVLLDDVHPNGALARGATSVRASWQRVVEATSGDAVGGGGLQHLEVVRGPAGAPGFPMQAELVGAPFVATSAAHAADEHVVLRLVNVSRRALRVDGDGGSRPTPAVLVEVPHREAGRPGGLVENVEDVDFDTAPGLLRQFTARAERNVHHLDWTGDTGYLLPGVLGDVTIGGLDVGSESGRAVLRVIYSGFPDPGRSGAILPDRVQEIEIVKAPFRMSADAGATTEQVVFSGRVGIWDDPEIRLHHQPFSTDDVGAGDASLALDPQRHALRVDAPGGVEIPGETRAGAITVTGSFTVGDATGYPIPAGGIIMWSGAEIPVGWVLCDGSQGTPDLRGQFVLGASSAAPVFPSKPNEGDIRFTAGSRTKTLTLAQMPKHNHGGVTSEVPGHTHDIQWWPAKLGTGKHWNNADLYPPTSQDMNGDTGNIEHGTRDSEDVRAWKWAHAKTSPTLGAGKHNHTIAENGGDEAFDIMPPYYTLAFIMKLYPGPGTV